MGRFSPMDDDPALARAWQDGRIAPRRISIDPHQKAGSIPILMDIAAAAGVIFDGGSANCYIHFPKPWNLPAAEALLDIIDDAGFQYTVLHY